MAILFAVTGSHPREAHLHLLVAFGLASLALDAGPLSSSGITPRDANGTVSGNAVASSAFGPARGVPAGAGTIPCASLGGLASVEAWAADCSVDCPSSVVASGNAHPTTDSPEGICGSGEAGVIHRFS